MIAISVVLTAAELTRPEFAGRALQLLVAGITIILAGANVRRRWGNPEPQIARPFVPPGPELTFGVETPDVSEQSTRLSDAPSAGCWSSPPAALPSPQPPPSWIGGADGR